MKPDFSTPLPRSSRLSTDMEIADYSRNGSKIPIKY
jgi:hypothetical protein